jgi:hypothetical protein
MKTLNPLIERKIKKESFMKRVFSKPTTSQSKYLEGGDKSKLHSHVTSCKNQKIRSSHTSSIIVCADSEDLDNILFDKDPKLLDTFNAQKKKTKLKKE